MPIYLIHSIPLAVVPRIISLLDLYSHAGVIVAGTVLGIFGSAMIFVALKRSKVADWFALTGNVPQLVRG